MGAADSNSPANPPEDGARPAALPAAPGVPVWRQDDGSPVSCLEKIKVLNENHAELRQIAQDAFEDALLMGCSEAQVRKVLHELVDALDNPYSSAPDDATAA